MGQFVSRHRRKLVALLFLILFVFGIANIKDYGMPYDEYTEKHILIANAKEYVYQLLPEESSIRVLADSMDAKPISDNIERDHGIAAYYGVLPLLYLSNASGNYASLNFMYTWHVYTYLLWFLGIISLYFLLKEVYKSSLIPPVGTVIFFFTPRIFAEGHYNNKDIIFLVFIIITLLFAVRSMKYMRIRDIIFFSLSSGFLMNAKTIGIAILGLTGLFAIVYFAIRRKEPFRKKALYLLIAIILSLLFYFLLTPASWSGPIEFIKYCVNNAAHFSRWDNTILFRGELVRPAVSGLPHSYLPQWMLMTTPVYISILFVVSCLAFIIGAVKSKGKNLVWQDREFFCSLFLISFLCPFLYAIINSSSFVLYNGWRHMYFLYGYYLLCAMYVLDVVLENYGKKGTTKTKAMLCVATVVVGIGFVSTFVDMMANRSYEYAYFNRPTRQFADLSGYEGDYWNVSVVSTLNDFAEEYYDGSSPLKVAVMGYAMGGQSTAAIENEKLDIVEAEEAEYFLFNLSIVENVTTDFGQYRKIFSTHKFGYDLSAIFVKE